MTRELPLVDRVSQVRCHANRSPASLDLSRWVFTQQCCAKVFLCLISQGDTLTNEKQLEIIKTWERMDETLMESKVY